MTYSKDDRVVITGGKYNGRAGKVYRTCSVVFPEYIRITLDLVGRQKVADTHMIELKYVQPEKQSDFLTLNKTQMSNTNKATKQAVHKMVPLAQIVVSKTNPRKAFDEDAIKELAISVKEKGVIQPVLLRFTTKADLYELVCGERRHRASGMAGLTELPAYIRELTDDEALELQITENLQRKDVHPMEEAYAFKQLLERYSVEEVANRVGKKDYFIKQRMKLNDLTPEWQKLFYKNLFTLTDALKLAVMNSTHQAEILKEKGIDKKIIDKTTKVHISDSDINEYKGQLSKAPFDLADATIDKKAGACTTCVFNSSFANLFPDAALNPICSNVSCYKRKCEISFELELNKALEEPAIIFISNNWHIDDDKIQERLKKQHHDVITSGNYNDIGLQDADILDYAEWEEDEWFDEDETEEEKRKKYDEYVADSNKDKAATEKKIATGKYLKGYIVDGTGKGKYKYIELKKKAVISEAKKSVDTGKASAADIDAEISRIRDRQKRNKELDGEKVHKCIVDAMKADKGLKALPASFSMVDKVLMRFLISEYMNYNNKDLIKRVIGLTNSTYGGGTREKLYQQLGSLTDPQLSFLIRTIVFDKYNTTLSSNSAGGYMLRKLAESLGTIPIDAFEQEQLEKAAKRQKNVDKRLAELQEQKKELKPKPAASKALAKKSAAKK